jgi:hypothetical protein
MGFSQDKTGDKIIQDMGFRHLPGGAEDRLNLNLILHTMAERFCRQRGHWSARVSAERTNLGIHHIALQAGTLYHMYRRR